MDLLCFDSDCIGRLSRKDMFRFLTALEGLKFLCGSKAGKSEGSALDNLL